MAPMSLPVQWRVSSRNFSRSSAPSSGCSGVPLKPATERVSTRPSFKVTVTTAASGVGRSLPTVMVTRSRERADLRIVQRALVEGAGIARIAEMRERHAERDAVLRHHDVGRRRDVVDPAILSLPAMWIAATSAPA